MPFLKDIQAREANLARAADDNTLVDMLMSVARIHHNPRSTPESRERNSVRADAIRVEIKRRLARIKGDEAVLAHFEKEAADLMHASDHQDRPDLETGAIAIQLALDSYRDTHKR
jgi:hypothetical protein